MGAPVGPYGGVSTRSFLPLLEGETQASKQPILIDVTQIGGTRLVGIYSEQLKLVTQEDDSARVLLFDLFTDPGETKNRATDMPHVVTRLRNQLIHELDSLPTLEPEFVEDETPPAVIEELKAMGYIQ